MRRELNGMRKDLMCPFGRRAFQAEETKQQGHEERCVPSCRSRMNTGSSVIVGKVRDAWGWVIVKVWGFTLREMGAGNPGGF